MRKDVILKNIIENLAEKQKRDTFIKNILVLLSKKIMIQTTKSSMIFYFINRQTSKIGV